MRSPVQQLDMLLLTSLSVQRTAFRGSSLQLCPLRIWAPHRYSTMEFTATAPAAAAAPAPQQHFVIFPEIVAQDDLIEVEFVEASPNHTLVKALVVGTGIAIVAAWCSPAGKSLRNKVAEAIKA